MPDPTPTIPPPRPSTPPVPLHKQPIKAREIVHAVAVGLAAVIMGAAQFSVALAFMGQIVHVFGIADLTATMVTGMGATFIFGSFLAGSPVDRGLDYVASYFGGPQISFTISDAEALKDAVSAPRPQRIPPSSTQGSASIHALGWLVFGFMAFLAGCSLLAGCGAQLSDSQRTALATETQRCLINEREIVDRTGTNEAQDRADLAAERARCDAARAAIVAPDGGTP